MRSRDRRMFYLSFFVHHRTQDHNLAIVRMCDPCRKNQQCRCFCFYIPIELGNRVMDYC